MFSWLMMWLVSLVVMILLCSWWLLIVFVNCLCMFCGKVVWRLGFSFGLLLILVCLIVFCSVSFVVVSSIVSLGWVRL